MRLSLFIPILLLLSLPVFAATCDSKTENDIRELNGWLKKDPITTAHQAIQDNHVVLLAIAGYSITTPGIDRTRCDIAQLPLYIMPGTSDVMCNSEHHQLIRDAASFAEKYNAALQTELEKRSRLTCAGNNTSRVTPPHWPVDPPLENTVQKAPIWPLRIGELSVVWDTTSLNEVMSAIGSGALATQGDAAESLSWLCYTISDTTPAQRLWLTSSEMGGGAVIDGFSAIETDAQAEPLCPRLPQRFLPVRLANGLWIGTSTVQVGKALGEATLPGRVQRYVHTQHRGDQLVRAMVTVATENARLTAIHLNYSTSD